MYCNSYSTSVSGVISGWKLPLFPTFVPPWFHCLQNRLGRLKLDYYTKWMFLQENIVKPVVDCINLRGLCKYDIICQKMTTVISAKIGVFDERSNLTKVGNLIPRSVEKCCKLQTRCAIGRP